VTGFNLPPGVTTRMIDEAAGADQPCEVCGHFVDDCICPECEQCGQIGDPACYGPGPCDCGPVKHWECNAGCKKPNHGLVRTQAQIDGRRAMDEAIEAQIRADRRIADHIDGYDRDDLGESPDY
jgi:hypothetical protein